MRRWADRRIGGWCVVVAVLLSANPAIRQSAAQQVASNRSTTYLFPTDVRDARAIWVNPAGLGVQREASIYAEVNVGDPGAKGRLRQINAGFNARGLSFAYQRDVLDDGQRGHTYRFGLAGGSGGLAAGFDVTHYRGDGAKATGWDLGASYVAHPSLNLGLVVTNIGQPVVRGLPQRLTYIPGATWRPSRPAGGAFGFSTYARITPDWVERYAFGVTWRAVGRPIEIIARMDTDRGFRRGAFVLGFSLGGENRVGAVVSTPGDVSRIEGASVYGLATREPARHH